MQKYKCLVVDDERLAQELLTTYIQKIPFLEEVATCSTALEAMQYLAQHQVDILFLDIQMPDLTGIEFLRTVKNVPATVLTTAYSEYALEGYELSVVDYLLKPIEFDRFFQAVMKVVGATAATPTAVPTPSVVTNTPTPPDYFFIKTDQKIVKIAFDDVLFIEALQKYIRIHTTTKRIVSLFSLSKIQELLPPTQFTRIHRSYLLNIDKMDSLEGNMVRIGTHTLPISKGQKEGFMTLLKEKGLFF